MVSMKDLAALMLKRGPMTPEEKREQTRSIVFGNLGLAYPSLTRAQVDEVADRIELAQNRKPDPVSRRATRDSGT